MTNDREVWKKISGGDVHAFNGFYREYAPRLQAYLRKVVGNAQAAEDIVQDTFTQIWNRPNGFNPDRGRLRAYLFGIGRKRAAEWWRKQRSVDPLTDDRMVVSQAETSSIIGDAFGRLPEEQRTLLWLREVEGQSYVELALILEIPVGTVRSRLFAAREALRRIWQNERSNFVGGRHEVQ